MGTMGIPVLSYPPISFPKLPKTTKIPNLPITPNPPIALDCELQPNQMMGELGGLSGGGEVEIDGDRIKPSPSVYKTNWDGFRIII